MCIPGPLTVFSFHLHYISLKLLPRYHYSIRLLLCVGWVRGQKHTHTSPPLYTNECFEFGHGNTKAIYNRGAPRPPGRGEKRPFIFEKGVWENATRGRKGRVFFPPLGGPPGGPPRVKQGGVGGTPITPPGGGFLPPSGTPESGIQGPPIAHFMCFLDVGVMPKTIVRPKHYVSTACA